MNFLNNLLDLSLEAAPWLVLGFLIGGLMKALIPTAFLKKHLSGDGTGSVIKATLLGAPLPLCSCGVIPAAMGLRKAGASKPATVSFLVSTPETGVDSVTVTYALMGPVMAIVRPISALVSAFVAGMLVAIFGNKEEQRSEQGVAQQAASANHQAATSSCCDKPDAAEKSCCDTSQTAAPGKTSCCASDDDHQSAEKPQKLTTRMLDGIRYAFTDLFAGIVFWLSVGLVFAAVVKTYVPVDFLTQWGTGLLAMLVMLLVGIPMYICATASTPLVAGLMMAGLSPGVALVLLLSGPATNIGSLGIIRQELGTRTMALYLAGTSIVAVLSGLLLDASLRVLNIDVHAQMNMAHDQLPAGVEWLGLLILIAAFLYNQFQKIKH